MRNKTVKIQIGNRFEIVKPQASQFVYGGHNRGDIMMVKGLHYSDDKYYISTVEYNINYGDELYFISGRRLRSLVRLGKVIKIKYDFQK